MTWSLFGLGVLVFVASVVIDFAHASYVNAVRDRSLSRSVLWSLTQWSAATVAFVMAVKVSLWLLPFEAAGLAVGTVLALRRRMS